MNMSWIYQQRFKSPLEKQPLFLKRVQNITKEYHNGIYTDIQQRTMRCKMTMNTSQSISCLSKLSVSLWPDSDCEGYII